MTQEMNEDPELKKEAQLYLEDSYREYIKEKYLVDNPTILGNPAILKMIFALEWYDIPRNCYSVLIEMHPYLTRGDYEKLQ